MADLGYLFSSEPRPVQTIERKTAQQPKYRDVTNIMFDKRVVRGPTVRSKAEQQQASLLTVTKLGATSNNNGATIRANPAKPVQAKSNSTSSSHAIQLTSIASFHATSVGAPSMACQTDDYLEDLGAEIFESDGITQTDSIADDWNAEQVLALFAPATRGVDASTCIEGAELFDFDTEVEAILQVLVGKALDQSLIETTEEEELAFLEREREKFANERALVLAETQRLESEHARRVAEKQRRFEQERARLIAEHQQRAKREAAVAAQAAMLELQRRTEAVVKAQWRDPVKQEVEEKFLPWLQAQIEARIQQRRGEYRAVDQLIELSLTNLATQVSEHDAKLEAERLDREQREREEAEAKAAADAERIKLIESEKARQVAEVEARLKAEAEAAAKEADAEGDGEGDEDED